MASTTYVPTGTSAFTWSPGEAVPDRIIFEANARGYIGNEPLEFKGTVIDDRFDASKSRVPIEMTGVKIGHFFDGSYARGPIKVNGGSPNRIDAFTFNGYNGPELKLSDLSVYKPPVLTDMSVGKLELDLTFLGSDEKTVDLSATLAGEAKIKVRNADAIAMDAFRARDVSLDVDRLQTLKARELSAHHVILSGSYDTIDLRGSSNYTDRELLNLKLKGAVGELNLEGAELGNLDIWESRIDAINIDSKTNVNRLLYRTVGGKRVEFKQQNIGQAFVDGKPLDFEEFQKALNLKFEGRWMQERPRKPIFAFLTI